MEFHFFDYDMFLFRFNYQFELYKLIYQLENYTLKLKIKFLGKRKKDI